jgi:radical SAM superfamily enzyme YgiQ (UPF0313 family)
MDTRFLHNKEVVKEICEGLISKGLRVSWDCVCYESINYLDKGFVALMRQADCEAVLIGIESGSNRIRKIIKKEGTVEEIKQNVLLIKNDRYKGKGIFCD